MKLIHDVWSDLLTTRRLFQWRLTLASVVVVDLINDFAFEWLFFKHCNFNK